MIRLAVSQRGSAWMGMSREQFTGFIHQLMYLRMCVYPCLCTGFCGCGYVWVVDVGGKGKGNLSDCHHDVATIK